MARTRSRSIAARTSKSFGPKKNAAPLGAAGVGRRPGHVRRRRILGRILRRHRHDLVLRAGAAGRVHRRAHEVVVVDAGESVGALADSRSRRRRSRRCARRRRRCSRSAAAARCSRVCSRRDACRSPGPTGSSAPAPRLPRVTLRAEVDHVRGLAGGTRTPCLTVSPQASWYSNVSVWVRGSRIDRWSRSADTAPVASVFDTAASGTRQRERLRQPRGRILRHQLERLAGGVQILLQPPALDHTAARSRTSRAPSRSRTVMSRSAASPMTGAAPRAASSTGAASSRRSAAGAAAAGRDALGGCLRSRSGLRRLRRREHRLVAVQHDERQDDREKNALFHESVTVRSDRVSSASPSP